MHREIVLRIHIHIVLPSLGSGKKRKILFFFFWHENIAWVAGAYNRWTYKRKNLNTKISLSPNFCCIIHRLSTDTFLFLLLSFDICINRYLLYFCYPAEISIIYAPVIDNVEYHVALTMIALQL